MQHVVIRQPPMNAYRTARLLLRSAVVGRSGIQFWRRSCHMESKAGAPDGVCTLRIHSRVIMSSSHSTRCRPISMTLGQGDRSLSSLPHPAMSCWRQ
ncbi:hypothetical protein LI328DRAFT_132533 [Trichoderma asperelloides]|nr:hypothetical protein LI328DRAFT_132533 [Trichoderma asperelloides]